MTVNYELLQKFLEEEGTLMLTENDVIDFGFEPDIYAVSLIIILCIKKKINGSEKIVITSGEYNELFYSVFFNHEKNEMEEVSKIKMDKKLVSIMETAFLIIKDVEISGKEMMDEIFTFINECLKKLWPIWYRDVMEVHS